jgi:ribose transport system ATP-binding protein
VVDEPTQGVDVGAIPVLYEKVHEAARRGAAVLVITSSIDEAVALASRAVVLDDGRITAELSGDRLTVPALAEAVVARTSPHGPGPAHPTTREDVAS